MALEIRAATSACALLAHVGGEEATGDTSRAACACRRGPSSCSSVLGEPAHRSEGAGTGAAGCCCTIEAGCTTREGGGVDDTCGGPSERMACSNTTASTTVAARSAASGATGVVAAGKSRAGPKTVPVDSAAAGEANSRTTAPPGLDDTTQRAPAAEGTGNGVRAPSAAGKRGGDSDIAVGCIGATPGVCSAGGEVNSTTAAAAAPAPAATGGFDGRPTASTDRTLVATSGSPVSS